MPSTMALQSMTGRGVFSTAVADQYGRGWGTLKIARTAALSIQPEAFWIQRDDVVPTARTENWLRHVALRIGSHFLSTPRDPCMRVLHDVELACRGPVGTR